MCGGCRVSPVRPDHHGEEEHNYYYHTTDHSHLQLLTTSIKGLVVLLILPTVTPLLWRLPGSGMASSPIREITSRLFHMGQTVVRMVGSLSGNYPSPHHQHYQHYNHHHMGKVILTRTSAQRKHFRRQPTGIPGISGLSGGLGTLLSGHGRSGSSLAFLPGMYIFDNFDLCDLIFRLLMRRRSPLRRFRMHFMFSISALLPEPKHKICLMILTVMVVLWVLSSPSITLMSIPLKTISVVIITTTMMTV